MTTTETRGALLASVFDSSTPYGCEVCDGGDGVKLYGIAYPDGFMVSDLRLMVRESALAQPVRATLPVAPDVPVRAAELLAQPVDPDAAPRFAAHYLGPLQAAGLTVKPVSPTMGIVCDGDDVVGAVMAVRQPVADEDYPPSASTAPLPDAVTAMYDRLRHLDPYLPTDRAWNLAAGLVATAGDAR